MRASLTILACAGFVFLQAAKPPSLTHIPIPSGHSGAASAINSAGEVVGTECDPVGSCAIFFWSQKAGYRPIATAPRYPEPVFFLNDRGDVAFASGNTVRLWSLSDGLQAIAQLPNGVSVAGLNKHREIAVSSIAGGQSAAFFISRRGDVIPTGALSPNRPSQAFGINDHGAIVGQSAVPCDSLVCTINGVTKPCAGYSCYAGTDVPRTFVWTSKNGIRDVDTAAPTRAMYGFDINERGEVAGVGYSVYGEQNAFLANEKQGTTFFTCGGRCPAFARLNDHGQVLGWYIRTGSGTGSFSWTSETGTQTIDAPNVTSTQGYAINNRGEIVGRAFPSPEPVRFIWSAATGLVMLDEINPSAINDKGEIAGGCVVAPQITWPCILRR